MKRRALNTAELYWNCTGIALELQPYVEKLWLSTSSGNSLYGLQR